MRTETLTDLIWRHVDTFVTRGQGGGAAHMNMGTFAAVVREHYERQVPPNRRRIHFSDQPDVVKRMRLDAQTLSRFKSDEGLTTAHKFGLPVELMEPVIEALESLGYRDFGVLQTELATRRGMLPAPIPPMGTANALVQTSRLTKEFSDVLAELAKTGDEIGPEDAHLAKNILQQINELEGVLHSTKAQVIAIIPEQDQNVVGFK